MKFWVFSLIPIYILYVIILGVFMLTRRLKAVREGRVDPKYFKSYQTSAPLDLEIIKNHFSNQFEVPILFMITCLSAFVTQTESWVLFILGVGFIVSRCLHTWVHLGSNQVLLRARVFFVGIFILILMWSVLILHLLKDHRTL